MTVDSYKYLPRSFRQGYAQFGYQADEPVWAPLAVPVEEATVALLTSAGLYLEGEQEPFDVEREKENPTWGDPTYRVIPRDVRQEQIARFAGGRAVAVRVAGVITQRPERSTERGGGV